MCSFSCFVIEIDHLSTPSFILGKLALEKDTIKTKFKIKYLVTLILLKGWSENNVLYPVSVPLTPFSLIPFTT